MLAVIMVLSVLVPAPAVEAAGKPSAPKSLNCRVCSKGNLAITNYASIRVKNFPKGAKIKNLKSSNKKVLTIVTDMLQDGYVGLSLLKAGKAVVSFDVVSKGKTTSLKTKVTVRKYERPCSSFKIGSREYASKFKKTSFYHQSYKAKKSKEKISIKAAKGWKLNSIVYYDSNGKEKKVKNKNYIKYNDDGAYITAYFQNKKTKEKQMIQISLHP